MIHSYRRVSTDDQVNSPQVQADAISQWVQTHTTEPYQDFFDNGVSGGWRLRQRPAGKKLLAALQPGDTVVVAKLDRLFRSVADAAGRIQEWNDSKIKLVAIHEGFDMTNPYGVAMAQMAVVFAELERAMIKSRVNAVVNSKKSRGLCVGQVPYGWDKSTGGYLVPNASEQHGIAVALELRRRKHSSREVAEILNDRGIRTKRGFRWTRLQVNKMFNFLDKNKERMPCYG